MARKSSTKPWDVVVDVLHRKNRNLHMPGLQQNLLGEIRIDQSASKANPALGTIGGVLPRHRMLIDIEERHIKIIDRLTLEENKKIAAKLKELTRSERYMMYQFDKFEDDQDHRLTDPQFRTFMWYLRRYVDLGHLRVIEGENSIPTAEQQMAACDHKKGKSIVVCDQSGFKAAPYEQPFWLIDDRNLDEHRPAKPEEVTA